MLQIASGKFYKTDQRYVTNAKSVLFSNYRYNIIDTVSGSIELVDPFKDISTYIFSYKNEIERDPNPGSFVLNRVGDKELVKQFKLLSFFGLKAFFSTEKSDVLLNTTISTDYLERVFVPSDFSKRFFTERIYGTAEEINAFSSFVKQMIGLPRKTYIQVISCLENLYQSLITLHHSIELSYSLLVYCLESLCQTFDDFEPVWEDYDQDVRVKMDSILNSLDEDAASSIREILINSKHLKAQMRFISFIKKYVQESYFTTDAVGMINPLRKSDLEQALRNSYDIRSKYAHQLLPMMKQLKVPHESEIMIWENNPYLTYNGLLRLTFSVIYQFVLSQPTIDAEDFDWRNNLPGVVSFYLAPEYWIHKTERFHEESATKRYEGLLNILTNNLTVVNSEDSPEMIDLTELLKLYELKMPQSKKKYRLPMFALYKVYNDCLVEDLRRPDYVKEYEKNKDLFKECSIELMTALLLTGEEWPWDLVECNTTFVAYQKKKYKTNQINLPKVLEVCLVIELANYALRNSSTEQYKEKLQKVIFEVPGQIDIQEKIRHFINEPHEINWAELFKKGD